MSDPETKGEDSFNLAIASPPHDFARPKPFQATVHNDAHSQAAVNVTINGEPAPTLPPGHTSDPLEVPVVDNSDNALLSVALAPGGLDASGEIHWDEGGA